MLLKDRLEASILLAHRLRSYGVLQPLILVVRREAIIFAQAVAEAMSAQSDVLLVQPLVAPSSVSLAPDPNDTFRYGGTGWWWPRLFVQRRPWLPGRPASEIRDRVVLLVDDGGTDAATLGTVVDLLRRAAPRRLVAAFAAASEDVVDILACRADEVICLATPADGDETISRFRQDLAAVSEEDVARAFEAVHGKGTALAA